MELFLDKDAIFAKLRDHLITEFNIDAGIITPEKRWEDDLDLDSLDAIDLLISLKDSLNAEADPRLFKDTVTLKDIVDSLAPIWKQP
jgi:acyl carrier protein